MNVGGVTTGKNTRTTHVVPGVTLPDDRGAIRAAACGQQVEVRWYEVNEGHETCRKCRRAMGWRN